ncbi:fimbrial assembly protein [Pseudomonas sp. N40(2020)]|uniref:CS1 type fimbrial major subunit n=1 Tax=Pseudomonas sp. N40(2020) TaxID=2767798 RepID=UPI0016570FBD|nr:CS1 type fimbrial major subunit [Pseudomonas sp. N40(2020)]MBC8999033.1 fimbrial assembly protein [Pseudomonas sp. N40(2020)]
MIKQCTVVALMATTGLTASVAWAAREEHTFEVSLTIPSRPFYIIPSEPDWIHRPQRLDWNHSTSSLSSVRKNFDVRHDTSAIEARLEAEPYLSNGRAGEEIHLQVSFNGVQLSAETTPRQVVSQEEAATGKRVLLQIDPIKPDGGYRPGDYSGNVLLLFNARAPGE